MASWADRLASTANNQTPAEPSTPEGKTETTSSCAVLDASALIGAVGYRELAEKCVTTPDVYAEVRDKKSKEALEWLHFGIEQREPAAAAVATGGSRPQ